MKRKEVISELDQVLMTYCEGCLLKAHFRKELGKKQAHRFCIKECTVGTKLKKFGDKLS